MNRDHSEPSALLQAGDVAAEREHRRRRRLWRIAAILAIPLIFLLVRLALGDPFLINQLSLPSVDPFLIIVAVFFIFMIAMVLSMTVVAGRSPHVTFRPEQIDVDLDTIVGIDPIKEDISRSLELFLAHKEFANRMGGSPRRGLLFEGPPGTGKTYVAKGVARKAEVPFLFVSATSFQSMYYGATARKIRSYFKALRRAARAEGGAIGFIEEIDAIAMTRRGVSASVAPARFANEQNRMISEGTGGVVNELLVQMQSFDNPTGWQRFTTWFVDRINLLLPASRRLDRPKAPPANVLLVAATNRADNLDPALLRPGRFDRRITFEPPPLAGRRQLIDGFLATRSHETELDEDAVRQGLAAVTQGYTPAMLEHTFDEALVNALRRGSMLMNRGDVERARLTEEVGLGQPIGYTDHERRLIATHEAGHATVAYLVAPHRRLDILSIIKRRDALGMLAHGDREDVFTRSESELKALMQISFGGMVAEDLFFGETSTGPASDLSYATTVAAQMIGACGMGDSLVSLSAIAGGGISEANLVSKVLSDSEGRAAVEGLLRNQFELVQNLMREHRHLVEALRDALLERNELIGTEILDVLHAAQPGRSTNEPSVLDLRESQPLRAFERDEQEHTDREHHQ